MNQYDTTFDLKINVGHCDLYFMALYLECYLMYEHPYLGLYCDLGRYNPAVVVSYYLRRAR